MQVRNLNVSFTGTASPPPAPPTYGGFQAGNPPEIVRPIRGGRCAPVHSGAAPSQYGGRVAGHADQALPSMAGARVQGVTREPVVHSPRFGRANANARKTGNPLLTVLGVAAAYAGTILLCCFGAK